MHAQASREQQRSRPDVVKSGAVLVREAPDAAATDAAARRSGVRPELVRTRIYAEGICCPSEVPLIRRILQPMAGVTQARPSHNIGPNSIAPVCQIRFNGGLGLGVGLR